MHTPTASIIAEYISALSTLAIALVGSGSLWTWRQKLQGETEYELARRLLAAVYKVREQIKSARSPMIPSGEFEAAMDEEQLEKAKEEFGPGYGDEGIRAVYEERWQRVHSAMAEVNVEALEAEAVWGNEATEAIEPLRKCVGKLFALIRQHVRYQTQDRQVDLERPQKIQKQLWGIGDEDELGQELDEAVESVEELARPQLELRDYSLWPF